MTALSSVVRGINVGTNMGLQHVLWALVSGRLHPSRGALLPALSDSGLSDQEVRRAWRASCHGDWRISTLIEAHRMWVKTHTEWKRSTVHGYSISAMDMVGFFRPKLAGCKTKHYHSGSGQALPAVAFGMLAEIGSIGTQRLPLLRQLERTPDAHAKHSHTALRKATIKAAREQQDEDEVILADAEFGAGEVLLAGTGRFILRADSNATYLRSDAKPYGGHGRKPTWGDVVRPLGRKYKDVLTPGSTPDAVERWILPDGREVRAERWNRVLLAKSIQKQVWRDHPTQAARVCATQLNVIAVHHPDYAKPLLLQTNLLDASARELASDGYLQRWPIEQLPLSAKHMVGAVRQFVSNPDHCQRLPELELLAGNILSCVAAAIPPISTGFWDHDPKPTPGRLRKALSKVAFPRDFPASPLLRKKNSLGTHFPSHFPRPTRILD
jgi:hypothetical protein